MHTYRTEDFSVNASPTHVWDGLHQGELVAILFHQRIKRAQRLAGEVNHIGYQLRYELMTENHDPTFSLLAEIVDQAPHHFVYWRYTWYGTTYNLRIRWKPHEAGSKLSIELETNYADIFLNLRLLFGKKNYTAGFDARFHELKQWLELPATGLGLG